MKSRCSSLILFAIIFFCGCSSTYIIKPNPKDYHELSSKIEEKECEITLTNGDVYIGEEIKVYMDSILWLESERLNLTITKPTSDIKKITFTNRSSGMGKGFGFGFLTGAVIGGLIGNTNEPSGGGMFVNLRGLPTVIGAAIGAVGGGLFGGLYGATNGDRDIYILNPLNEIFTDSQSTRVTNIKLEEKQQKEIFTIKINKIIKETEKNITILWGQKGIEIPKSEIIDIIEEEKIITIRVNKETYNAYFK